MSVNLNKNKAQILDAWKKVTENEDGYDWALYGYEGKSNVLKLVKLKKKLRRTRRNLILLSGCNWVRGN